MRAAYRTKPKTDFGIEVKVFTAQTGMMIKELAANSGVKYTTLIETTTGRCAGHQLIPVVREFMENYQREGGVTVETVKTVHDMFYFVEDIMQMLGYSRSKSYKIIAALNRELEASGVCVCDGRVNKKYFNKRYGLDEPEQGQRGRRTSA